MSAISRSTLLNSYSLALAALACQSLTGAWALPQEALLNGGVQLDWLSQLPLEHPQLDNGRVTLALGPRHALAGSRITNEGALPEVCVRDTASGALLWSQVYDLGPGSYGTVYDLEASPDGQVLYALLGTFLFAPAWQQPSSGQSEVRVLAMSAVTGNLLWQWQGPQYSGATLRSVALSRSLAGDRLVVSGERFTTISGARDLLLWGLSAAGDLVWQEDFDSGQADVVEASAAIGARHFIAVRTSPSGWYLRSHDMQQGTLLWSRSYAGPGDKLRDLEASAALDALAVCNQSLNLIDASNGDQQWQQALGDPLSAEAAFDAAGTRVFVAYNAPATQPNQLRFVTQAFDTASGSSQWLANTQIPNQGLSGGSYRLAGLSLAPDGQRLVVASTEVWNTSQPPWINAIAPWLWQHDTATGATLWLRPGPANSTAVTPGPLWANDGQALLIAGTRGSNAFQDLISSAYRSDNSAELWSASLDNQSGGNEQGAYLLADANNERVFALSTLNGAATGVELSARQLTTGALLWSRTIPVVGLQNPRLALSPDGSRLCWQSTYYGGAGPNSLATRLECLDATSGQELWQTAALVGRGWDFEFSPDGQRVFAAIESLAAGQNSALTYAYNAMSGLAQWSHELNQAGFFEVPKGLVVSADGQHLFIHGWLDQAPAPSLTSDVYFLNLNTQTGQQFWLTNFASEGATTQRTFNLAHAPQTNRLHAVGQDHQAALSLALDATTGQLLWNRQDSYLAGATHDSGLLALSSNGVQVVSVGRAILGGPNPAPFFVTLQDAATGTPLWSKLLGSSLATTVNELSLVQDGQTILLTGTEGQVVAYGSGVYAAGFTRALDFVSGTDLWSARLGNGQQNVELRAAGVSVATGQVITAGSMYQPGDGRDQVLAAFSLPTLIGNPSAVSLAAGGSQYLNLRAGQDFAGATHLVLGSISGTAPGIALAGGTLPLNPDAYLTATLTSPNQAPLLGTLGSLDTLGQGFAEIRIPAGAAPTLAGLTLNHAAIGVRFNGPIPCLDWISNPLELKLTP